MSTPHWASDSRNVPIAVLGSLAVGAGGRLTKHLIDLLNRAPEEASVSLPKKTEAEVDYPVDVTPEEARKLQSRGIDVKVAGVIDNTVNAIGYGGLGAAGAIGGWKLTDMVIDKLRRRAAEKQVESVRKRLKQVLDDTPAMEDKELHSMMKTAEAMVKEALGLPELGAVLGAGLAASGYGAFRTAANESKSRSKLSALRELLARQPAQVPQVRMVPRVSKEALRKLLQREQEKRKAEAEAVKASSPSEQAVEATVLAGA